MPNHALLMSQPPNLGAANQSFSGSEPIFFNQPRMFEKPSALIQYQQPYNRDFNQAASELNSLLNSGAASHKHVGSHNSSQHQQYMGDYKVNINIDKLFFQNPG